MASVCRSSRCTMFSALLIYSIHVSRSHAQTKGINNSTIQDIIIEQAKYFCHVEAVCPEEFDLGLIDSSCCKSCSCDANCHSFKRCCFPNHPNGNQMLPPYQQCQYTRTKANEAYGPLALRAYYMVDVCPDTHAAANGTNEKCGDIKVVPWGNLFPVFSKTSGLIYKNQECAKCHNTTDGTEWNILLRCLNTWASSNELGLNDHIDLLGESKFPDHCHVDFIPPDGISWSEFKTNKCFDIDLIDHCAGRDFNVPKDIPMTRDEIVRACESGFWSPYLVTIKARNVFCHICNGELTYRHEMCQAEPGDDIRGDENLYTFTMLLNAATVMKIVSQDREQSLKACKMTNSDDDCRPIQCPSGQLRNDLNKCLLPSVKWFGHGYDIFVHLTPKEDLTFSIVKKAVINKGDAAFKSPLPRVWKTRHIMFQTDSRSSNSKSPIGSIVANYYYVGAVNNAARFLASIDSSLKSKWTFVTGNKNYELVAKMWEFSSIKIVEDTIVPEWLLNLESRNPSIVTSIPFSDIILRVAGEGHTNTGMVINRLHFCMQITLSENEYTDIESVIFHNETGKYFFDNQYIKTYSTGGEVRLKICMDDVGYMAKGSMGSDSSLHYSESTTPAFLFVVSCVIVQVFSTK